MLNNYTQDEEEDVKKWHNKCKYLSYGREVGESGTPHLQGFVIFKIAVRFAAVKKMCPRAHWEKKSIWSTNREAADYTKKDGDYVEIGQLPMTADEKGEMERVRWERIRDLARGGQLDEIDAQVYVCHYRTLKEIARDNMREVDMLDGPCGLWIYGRPGVGKSYYARKEWPQHFVKELNKWWDGYKGEDTVIIDDMDPGHSQSYGRLLKIWADAYPFIGETKGGAMRLRPRRIVVTSQYCIRDVFDDQETYLAIRRRFEEKLFSPFSTNALFKEEDVSLSQEASGQEDLQEEVDV